MSMQNFSRREAVKLGLAGLVAAGTGDLLDSDASSAKGQVLPSPTSQRPFLTPAGDFRDVSRGHPKPFTLQGDALVAARLTPETWRLEITADAALAEPVKLPTTIAKRFTLADGTALDMAALRDVGKKHGAKFLKAMQCLNIPAPLGQACGKACRCARYSGCVES